MRAIYERKLQLATELGNLEGLPPLSAALAGTEHPALRRMPKTGAFVHLNEVTPPTYHALTVLTILTTLTTLTMLTMLSMLTIHPPPQRGHVAAGVEPALHWRQPERAVVRVAGREAHGGAHRGREHVQAARPPALPRRVRGHPRGRAEAGGGGGAPGEVPPSGAARATADQECRLKAARVGQRGGLQHSARTSARHRERVSSERGPGTLHTLEGRAHSPGGDDVTVEEQVEGVPGAASSQLHH